MYNLQQVNLINSCVQINDPSFLTNVRPEIVTRIYEYGVHRVNTVEDQTPLNLFHSEARQSFIRAKNPEKFIFTDPIRIIAKRWRHSKKLHLAARSRGDNSRPRDKYSFVTRRPFNPAIRAARFLISINSNSIGLSGRPNRVQSAGRRRETG